MAKNKVVFNGQTIIDLTDTTATAADVASGKYFYGADGVRTAGTASGGGGGLTQHTIHLEFTDSTDTDIEVDYDDPLIGTMITAYNPSTWTYNTKLVSVAELDGVEWYNNTITWETLDEGQAWYEADTPYPYCWLSDLGNVQIPLGDTYRITFDNVEYVLTVTQMSQSNSNSGLIGNPLYDGGTDDGSGVPFCFYQTLWGSWSGTANVQGNTNHSLKIEHQVTS